MRKTAFRKTSGGSPGLGLPSEKTVTDGTASFYTTNKQVTEALW